MLLVDTGTDSVKLWKNGEVSHHAELATISCHVGANLGPTHYLGAGRKIPRHAVTGLKLSVMITFSTLQ